MLYLIVAGAGKACWGRLSLFSSSHTSLTHSKHTRLLFVTIQTHALHTKRATKNSNTNMWLYDTCAHSHQHTWTKKDMCNYILRTRMHSNTIIRVRILSHALKSRRHGINHQSYYAHTYTKSSLLDSPPMFLGQDYYSASSCCGDVSFLAILPVQVGGTNYGCWLLGKVGTGM